MIEKIVNHGWQEPTILGSDYWMGEGHGLTLGKEVLVPDRDWRPFLPKFEPQRRAIETSSCSQQSTLNPTETLIKRKYGLEKDYSDRALAIASNNSPMGNDPNITAETLRKQGALNEEDLPFTDEIRSWQEYMTPNPLPNYLTVKAKRWGYDFKHEWA